MTDNEAPTSASTSPLGNSSYIKPTPLARGINVNAQADWRPANSPARHD
jgi:hypothetical protein